MIYERAFDAGISFAQFVAGATENRDMWQAMATRTPLAPEAVEQVRAVSGRWRLLAIAEDWCGDAVNILPVVARLARESGRLDLRIVGRDAWPRLMDRHLTNGSRSIPVIILLDDVGTCRGWWGPRPSRLQAWFEREGRPLGKDARYRELRRWYARDRGRAIALEIAELVSCGASDGRGDCANVHSCGDLQAA
ncbi:MAG: thioredoxin family protein [Gemmatimonadota bacterium]